MSTLPSFMWLGGDEDGGVTAICDHTTHEPEGERIAYHAGWGADGAPGLPYFSSRDLAGFFDFIRTHAQTHAGGN